MGLRHVSDVQPGIRRVRSGKGFRYLRANGRTVKDHATLARIRSLAIPPAWTDVWICPAEDGHIQASGRDARRRKQYRYHPRWRELRDETKYTKVVDFARALPRIRRRVARDLRRKGLPREKVLATVVSLLETTLIRVGNEEYVRENGSFGLTTLRDQHVRVRGAELRFHFRGKGGKQHKVAVNYRRLARIVKQCQDLPGQELFQYEDDEGELRPIDSADVNEYVRAIAGEEFSAKDFRTWAGTVLASIALQALGAFRTKTQAEKSVVRAIEAVAGQLGNTPAICRKCYVHPTIIETYLDGGFVKAFARKPDETTVLAFLEKKSLAASRRRAA